jgi:hypothetical protein
VPDLVFLRICWRTPPVSRGGGGDEEGAGDDTRKKNVFHQHPGHFFINTLDTLSCLSIVSFARPVREACVWLSRPFMVRR